MKILSEQNHEIKVDLIDPDPDQPRKFPDAELSESIEAIGQVKAVQVRQHPHDPGRFMIVDGERRWRAISKLCKGHEVPTIRCELLDADGDELFMLQLLSNVARKSLTLTEEIRGIKHLSNKGWTPDSISRYLGISSATVEADLPIADLPDTVIEKAVEAGHPKSVLRAIAKHKDPTKAIRAAGKARGKSTKEMLAAIDYSSQQQAGEVSKDEYDPAAGKALDKLVKRINQFVKTTAVSDAVAARTGKLDDLQLLVSKMRRLTTELETEVAKQSAKRAA